MGYDLKSFGKVINLKNTTLCAVSSIKIEETIRALKICQSYADFKDIKFLTDIDLNSNYFSTIKIPKISSLEEYSDIIINMLPEHIETDYVLICQHDGFIINPESWSNIFFEYDFIGAPWPFLKGMVGNGGFSLRSKRFLDLGKEVCKNDIIDFHEDAILCQNYRRSLEHRGIIFASTKIGYKFSTEQGKYQNSFGFHNLEIHNLKNYGWKCPI